MSLDDDDDDDDMLIDLTEEDGDSSIWSKVRKQHRMAQIVMAGLS